MDDVLKLMGSGYIESVTNRSMIALNIIQHKQFDSVSDVTIIPVHEIYIEQEKQEYSVDYTFSSTAEKNILPTEHLYTNIEVQPIEIEQIEIPPTNIVTSTIVDLTPVFAEEIACVDYPLPTSEVKIACVDFPLPIDSF